MEDDLVDSVKPGDRVEVIGVYRAMPKSAQGYTDGRFPCKLLANNIDRISAKMQERPWTGDDISMIKQIAGRDDALELLGRSFASNICGHEFVKQGLFLLMVGGVEKNLANGTHLRGDMNVLMIGDPSCGKSQLLRYCMNLAPNCISTTGRGSSGVGLTAAVTTDSFTKERRLEAGAMVLADRGVVCIDEFDKMSHNDRTAIHEVMEQQTVTIAKAGIHTSLNARCSVVAAANPIEGTWNTNESLMRNVNLPDSLLSRFDLIFLIRDQTTPEADRKIATQVLKSVRYKSKMESFSRHGFNQKVHSTVIDAEAPDEETETTDVFQKSMSHLYSSDDTDKPLEYLTLPFMKKYIRYVCENYEPVLTNEAVKSIAQSYAKLRTDNLESGNKENDLVITTRTLEALIRIATAHAKMKCRDEVTLADVEMACKLMHMSRNQGHDDFYTEVSEDSIQKRAVAVEDSSEPDAKRQRVDEPQSAEQRYSLFQQKLADVFGMEGLVKPASVPELVNTLLPDEEQFTPEVVSQYLAKMEQSGMLFASGDGSIMLI
jgi:DNA replication licensing factor MCM3